MNKNYMPPTTKRVSYHTCNNVNKKIRDETICCINTHKNSDETVLANKIEKLNHEWDTERFLETNAASVVLLSSIIGYKKSKCGLFLLTGAVGFFLLQHAFQGWCPPLPIIRKMGVRLLKKLVMKRLYLKRLEEIFQKILMTLIVYLAWQKNSYNFWIATCC